MYGSKRDNGMGFHNFRSFNLALLGKQTSRLLTNTNTRCYKIFKMKYFPNGDLLSASVGNNTNFV